MMRQNSKRYMKPLSEQEIIRINRQPQNQNWDNLCSKKLLPEELIFKYHHHLNFSIVCSRQDLSVPFIEKLIKEKILDISKYGEVISQYQKLNMPFIEKYKKHLDSVYLYRNQELSESFMEDIINTPGVFVYWYYIFKYQKLSENFISKYFKYDTAFHSLYRFQLSEKFLKKHCNDFNPAAWTSACLSQNLSKEFVVDNFDKINFKLLYQNKRTSQEIKDLYRIFNDNL